MSLKNDSDPTQQPHPMVTDWASKNGITITSSRVGKHGAIHSEGVATSPSTEYRTGLPKHGAKAKQGGWNAMRRWFGI
jgi:hypothetical protein